MKEASQLPNVAITLRRDEPSRENAEEKLTTDHTDSTDESQCLYPRDPRSSDLGSSRRSVTATLLKTNYEHST